MVKVTDFEIVGPYVLRVCFTDDSAQVIDFEPILYGEIYGHLRDLHFFNQVHIDPHARTLRWPNGADFDPETLRHWPVYQDAWIESVKDLGLPTEAPMRNYNEEVEVPPVAAIRKRLKLSQARFAGILGVTVRAVQDWEQGRRTPSGAASTLLRIADQQPEVFGKLVYDRHVIEPWPKNGEPVDPSERTIWERNWEGKLVRKSGPKADGIEWAVNG
jgi:transcriptional regulator with XRE-family HTH domain